MQNNSKVALWGGVLIAIVIAIALIISYIHSPSASFGAGVTSCNGGNCTNFDAVETSAGFWVNGSQIVNSAGAFIGTITAAALATFDAGIRHSYTNSTSTPQTTLTLAPAEIINYETVIVTPTIAATTLTLPASSTLSTFVPTAGDWQEQEFCNATGTAAATITLAAGTGIDLETASSSITGGGPVLSIPAQSCASLRYIRKPATATAFDIIVKMIRFADGD